MLQQHRRHRQGGRMHRGAGLSLLLWLGLHFSVTHVVFFLGLLGILKWLYITLIQLGKGYWIGKCIIS